MLQELAYFALIVATLILAFPYGWHLAKVFRGEPNLLTPLLRPIERRIYRVCGINENSEMTWKKYVGTLMGFEILGAVFAFVILSLQGVLPLNPHGVSSFRWDWAVNSAFSWVTNTNWIAYSGERDLSYLSQMLGVLVEDYVSPSVGFVSIVVLARSFSRKHSPTIGNFWVDFTRAILYVWIPLGLILVFPLISQGVVQNFDPLCRCSHSGGRGAAYSGRSGCNDHNISVDMRGRCQLFCQRHGSSIRKSDTVYQLVYTGIHTVRSGFNCSHDRKAGHQP